MRTTAPQLPAHPAARTSLQVSAVLRLLLPVLVAACNAPPHTVIEIHDPHALATDATHFAIGFDLIRMRTQAREGRPYPVEIVVTDQSAGARTIWVDALAAGGERLARGRADATLRSAGTRIQIRLGGVCDLQQARGAPCTLAGNPEENFRCIDRICQLSVCGDGYADDSIGEECDDGNSIDTDECLSAASDFPCSRNRCGDGYLHAPDSESTREPVEVCDDGNTLDGDGCSADCQKVEQCSDGVLDAAFGEACDDGNDNPNDGCNACALTRWTTTVVAGLGDGSLDPLDFPFTGPRGLARDQTGNLFVADASAHRVYRITPAGRVLLYAGTGVSGVRGTGGAAALAELQTPVDIVTDGFGTLYIADRSAHCVRAVDARTGLIENVAGICGEEGPDPDPVGAPTFTRLQEPRALAIDRQGRLYVAGREYVRRINRERNSMTIVTGPTSDPLVGLEVNEYGTELYFLTQGPAPNPPNLALTLFRVLQPGAVVTQWWQGVSPPPPVGGAGCAGTIAAADPKNLTLYDGDLLLADANRSRVVRIDLDTQATATVIAGVGTGGDAGDGGPAISALLKAPTEVVASGDGTLYVMDAGNRRVRAFTIGGDIDTFAGTSAHERDIVGTAATSLSFGGEDGDPMRRSATALALADDGALLFSDAGARVWRWKPGAQDVERFAGEVIGGCVLQTDGKDGPSKLESHFPALRAVATDLDGGVLVVQQAGSGLVRRIGPDGVVDAVGSAELNGDLPTEIAVRDDGRLFVRVRQRIVALDLKDAQAAFEVVVGDGTVCLPENTCGANLRNLPTEVQLGTRGGIAVGPNETLLVAEPELNLVREVRLQPVDVAAMVIFAGDGSACSVDGCGDGPDPTAAQLDAPVAIAYDGQSVLIAEETGHRIRLVDSSGITTLAGTGDPGPPSGDGGAAIEAHLGRPFSILAVGQTVFVGVHTDDDNPENLIRAINLADPGHPIDTVVGRIDARGNGTLAQSKLDSPKFVSLVRPSTWWDGTASSEALWLVSDRSADQIRVVQVSSQWLSSLVGRRFGSSALDTPARWSALIDRPGEVVWDGSSTLYFGTSTEVHYVDLSATPWTTGAVNVTGERFIQPGGAAFVDGWMFLADRGAHTLWKIDLTGGRQAGGVAEVIAGTLGQRGLLGAEGPAAGLLLSDPDGVAVAPDGSVYLADTGNHRVVRLAPTATGIVNGTSQASLVIGQASGTNAGFGGRAGNASIDTPTAMRVDAHGNLFIAARTHVAVISPAPDHTSADADGTIDALYGTALAETFPEDATRCVTGLELLAEDEVLVSDACAGLLLTLTREDRLP